MATLNFDLPETPDTVKISALAAADRDLAQAVDAKLGGIIDTAEAAAVAAAPEAVEGALADADVLTGREHRSPKTGATDRFRLHDALGRVAFEVRPDGTTFIARPSESASVLHLWLAVGQSNMSGRGLPVAGGPTSARIFEYGAKNRTLRQASVPLDMHDAATGLSPASAFADSYLKGQPSGVGVLLVPAAHGGTGFTNATNTLTWTPNAASAPQYDLPALAIVQTLEAIAAAQAAGYVVELKGILWHQGENNGSLSTASYGALLDSLIAYFRAQLNSPTLPFLVGQMVPEGIAANAGREKIDAAHQQTPQRVLYTGFAPATTNGHNAGDTTHMSRAGAEYLGKSYVTAYKQALDNNGLALKWSQSAGRTAYARNALTGADQLIYGDTGWRDVSGSLINGWTANQLQVRRVNNQVLIKGRALNGTAATAKGIVSLPNGFFEPSSQATFTVAGTEPIEVILTFQGELQLPTGRTYFPSTFYSISLAPIWVSTAWPTTLPGVASGSIPA